MDIVRTENLYKEYNLGKIKTKVINNVTLSIKEKEFVSIIGPSGSGKSTLLYLLSGMEEKTSGSIYLLGKDIDKLSDKEKCDMRRNSIGFVYQFYNLISEMNVQDNILLPKLIDNEKIDVERLNKIVKLVSLEKHLKSFPYELSGGQQQRVAIARAIYANPKIIFADEPTGNLDYKTGQDVMELFKKINEEMGTTIIQVTHSLEHAKYANRIIKIVDGEVCNE
ncbi:ABC transporter ATP-binding protein [uncultured Clostridium sp.]|uniref:ABC transporter ATP-binding protein n=1 Tax=uncultured Clostridium sp. TaxID=59620 RepID=UPI0025D323E5|nr:ABC transporter ATP-binding protein [uncultured Clostridium sp.]